MLGCRRKQALPSSTIALSLAAGRRPLAWISADLDGIERPPPRAVPAIAIVRQRSQTFINNVCYQWYRCGTLPLPAVFLSLTDRPPVDP